MKGFYYMDNMEEMALETLGQVQAVISNSHIVSDSEKHSSAYVNKNALYPFSHKISALCQMIAMKFTNDDVEVVVGSAVGGGILSQWIGFYLSEITQKPVLSLYAEKEVATIPDPEGLGRKCFVETGAFVIERGYEKLVQGKRVLVVEDISTTGTSASRVVQAARARNGHVIGAAILCNCGELTARHIADVPRLFSLVNIKLDEWEPGDCPLCKEGIIPINILVGKGKQFLERLAITK